MSHSFFSLIRYAEIYCDCMGRVARASALMRDAHTLTWTCLYVRANRGAAAIYARSLFALQAKKKHVFTSVLFTFR